MRMVFLALLIVAALPGCFPASRPDVLLMPADASLIAVDLSSYLAKRFPVAATTLCVAPVEDAESDHVVTATSVELRGLGFAVFDGSGAPTDCHSLTVRARVAPDQVVALLDVDGDLVARLYVRALGGPLLSSGQFTVRQSP